jgi:hypothetical protein
MTTSSALLFVVTILLLSDFLALAKYCKITSFDEQEMLSSMRREISLLSSGTQEARADHNETLSDSNRQGRIINPFLVRETDYYKSLYAIRNGFNMENFTDHVNESVYRHMQSLGLYSVEELEECFFFSMEDLGESVPVFVPSNMSIIIEMARLSNDSQVLGMVQKAMQMDSILRSGQGSLCNEGRLFLNSSSYAMALLDFFCLFYNGFVSNETEAQQRADDLNKSFEQFANQFSTSAASSANQDKSSNNGSQTFLPQSLHSYFRDGKGNLVSSSVIDSVEQILSNISSSKAWINARDSFTYLFVEGAILHMASRSLQSALLHKSHITDSFKQAVLGAHRIFSSRYQQGYKASTYRTVSKLSKMVSVLHSPLWLHSIASTMGHVGRMLFEGYARNKTYTSQDYYASESFLENQKRQDSGGRQEEEGDWFFFKGEWYNRKPLYTNQDKMESSRLQTRFLFLEVIDYPPFEGYGRGQNHMLDILSIRDWVTWFRKNIEWVFTNNDFTKVKCDFPFPEWPSVSFGCKALDFYPLRKLKFAPGFDIENPMCEQYERPLSIIRSWFWVLTTPLLFRISTAVPSLTFITTRLMYSPDGSLPPNIILCGLFTLIYVGPVILLTIAIVLTVDLLVSLYRAERYQTNMDWLESRIEELSHRVQYLEKLKNTDD